jgi:adenine phosphoribosyltransferase
MPTQHTTHSIVLAGLQRDLRLFEIKPGVRIAILNILGDTELVHACAEALSQKVKDIPFDVIVTAEAKSIPIAHELAVDTHKRYIVLRKRYKSYMGNAIQAETLSITTGETQKLFLDEKDAEALRGARVVLLDDVISTGSTLRGMRSVMEKAGATVVAEAAICTEGDPAQWKNIIALGHLPVFIDYEKIDPE